MIGIVRSPSRARCRLWLAMLLVLGVATGCSSGRFYMQAARGGLALQLSARPIDRLLERNDLSAELRQRLSSVVEMRTFARQELGLTVRKSYRQYAEIEREFVVWNVVAAPQLGLDPKRWCYPVAGCVTYRGYFRKPAAERLAERLSRRGFDVAVQGVTAYSTLGWLSDPVLDTFLFDSEAELAGTLFHELAHATFYAKGDATFNESLATVVEEYAVEQWLVAHSRSGLWQSFTERARTNRAFSARMVALREQLAALYSSAAPPDEKRVRKSELFERFVVDAGHLAAEEPRFEGWARWAAAGLNNAHLVAVGTYWDWVPALRGELSAIGWPAFVELGARLAQLPYAARQERLAELAESVAASADTEGMKR